MATVSLYFDKRREKKDSKYPVKITIYHDGTKRRYGVGVDLTEEEWGKINSPKLRDEQLKEYKSKIERYKNKALEKIKDLEDSFTFDKFEREFFQKPSKSNRSALLLENLFNDYIIELKNNDSISTSQVYRCALNSFKAFRENLLLTDISPELLNEYEKQMRKTTADKKGSSVTTISMYQRALRKIFNRAISKGLIKKEDYYPFGDDGKYEIPSGKNIKKALDYEEIKKIFEHESELIGEQRARDF